MQGTHHVQRLNAVVDDIFVALENVRSMLISWDNGYRMSFIEQVMSLQKLEVELYDLGYDEEFVYTVVKVVYQHVFREVENNAIPNMRVQNRRYQ